LDSRVYQPPPRDGRPGRDAPEQRCDPDEGKEGEDHDGADHVGRRKAAGPAALRTRVVAAARRPASLAWEEDDAADDGVDAPGTTTRIAEVVHDRQ